MKLSDKLKYWRCSRQLSLGGLALKSGVHKSTLSYWESGKRQPCITELNKVLQALNLSTGERTVALRLIEAPRAVEVLRQDGEGVLTLGTDLLRALRLRKRLTQSELAMNIGVSRTTIANWEIGKSWPDADRLNILCTILEADMAETNALAQGRFLSQYCELSREEWWSKLDHAVFHIPLWKSKELSFFLLRHHCDWSARQGADMTAEMVNWVGRYSQYLVYRGRLKEAQEVLYSAPRLTGSIGKLKSDWSVVIIMNAAISISGRARISVLKHGLAVIREKQMRSWMWSELGTALAENGELSEGLRCMEIAYQEAMDFSDSVGHGVDLFTRKREWASLLVEANLPEEALTLCPVTGSVDRTADSYGRDELFWSSALWAVGARAEAHTWLLRAETLNRQSLFAYDIPRINKVKQRFLT